MGANVVSGARDRIRDQFTSGLSGPLSLRFGTASLQSGEEQPLARSDTCRAWRRSGDGFELGDAREP